MTSYRDPLHGAVALVCLFVLGGCGGSSSGSPQEAAPTPTVRYTVSVDVGAGGSISPAGGEVEEGETLSFTITPDAGFALDDVSGCGGSLVDLTYTTGPITAACTVSVSFVEDATAQPPPAGDFSLSGRVINRPVAGAEVEVRRADGELITTVLTDDEGFFEASVPAAGAYEVSTLGGELDGQPYQGVLRARCLDEVSCAVTPWSTAIRALQGQAQLDYESARLQLGNRVGLQFDPFTVEASALPDDTIDIAALRDFLDFGSLLDLWIQDLLAWLDDPTGFVPAGIVVRNEGTNLEPDPACSDFDVVVDEPHYLVDSHAALAAALEDPEGRADGRLVIGITDDINDGPDGAPVDPTTCLSEWWFYNGTTDLVLIGWREDGERPVIDLRGGNRALRVQSAASVTLSGLEIRDGNANRTCDTQNRGGAVAVSQRIGGVGDLFVHDSVFRENRTNVSVPPFSLGRGGAIWSAGFILISRSEFHDNFSREGGGAVYSRRGINVCHSRFEGNRINHGAATVRSGSAIMLRNSEASGDLRIHDSVFIGNEALSEQGGVLYLEGVGRGAAARIGEIIITESEFIDNSSNLGAAVVYSEGVATSTLASDPTPGSADVYIIDSRLVGNFTTEGGPILEANEANIFIINSVFEDNEVPVPQSLIVANGGTIEGSTFSDNSNPVFVGDFSDEGGNQFLGSSANPFGPRPGRIAFHEGGSIWLVDPDGENRELVLDVGFIQPSPAWSPDGSQLVYVGGPASRSDLFRYSLANQQVQRLTDEAGVSALEPTWSVNGEIAYVRRNESFGTNPFLIYVTGPAGGVGEHLTGAQAAADMERFPSWSPDGETLVFSVREDWSSNPSSADLRLYTIGRDGSDRARLPAFAGADQPAWSPDGDRIAYVEDGTVFVRRADASDQPLELATGDRPTWSPDGLEIAFHREGRLYRVSLAQPGEPVFITEGDQPAWR